MVVNCKYTFPFIRSRLDEAGQLFFILLIANYNAIPLFLECAPGQIDRLFDVKWLSLNGNIA